MKKNTITTLAMIAAFAMTASSVEAQIQTEIEKDLYGENIVVFDEKDEDKDQDEFLDRAAHNENVEMPQAEKTNITIDYCAPLGEGILLLSCLGGAYLLGKRRKE